MGSSSRLQNLLQRTMASLATPLDQLVFLASIRDAYTGRYLHEGWSQVATSEDVHDAAHHMHCAAFASVLEMNLQEMARGLHRHFENLGGDEEEMARLWLENEPFREMLPTSCSVMEREFFVSQMRLALTITAAQAAAAAPRESSASPHPQPVPQSPRRQDE